uniref:Uncharacterized protein n=1 Tax=Phlebotomus papatasi TaxID=29031 RepID=A0A1B0DAP2_PHLPP
MRSNEISINPIATLVLQSEYPAQETRERDYTGNVSKSSKTPKSLTSQEVEEKWSTSGKGRGWGNLEKQRYYSKTAGHHTRKHRHHHHRDHGHYMLRNNAIKKKSKAQGRIDYYDKDFNAGRRDNWSNFIRLQNQLERDKEEDIPPYMKKINRRTKQLRILMEGTGTVPPRRHRIPASSVREPKWLDENVFDEQRPNAKKISVKKSEKSGINSLPDEESSEVAADSPSVFKSATRAGNFIYHRIPSAKPNTGPTFGRVVRKQGLPFVAITDRRTKLHP